MITLRNLRKSFGELKAVDGVSIQVKAGESLGLLGPNGAGKTTTIRMLVGALFPDDGEALIDGEPAHSKTARARIGIAPQSLALYEEFTAAENLIFFASLYGLRGSLLRERVAWALELAQLEDRRGDRVGKFSGGMKRRLNLATALVHDPAILLLDEPTVGVDPQSRNHIFDCIERLHAEGRTIIYTTHYMEEVQRLCDQVAIMDHGRLLAVDTVEGLIADHADMATVTAELESVPQGYTLPGSLEASEWTFKSPDPFSEIAKATSAGVQLAALNVSRPTLENVFLNLTGRSLRD